ncbi:MAG: hypothetical protein CM15mP95_2360 [Alphaproteobacteria bacterium]|nr:MAG: hypothetical protein CM15mP95_2360 [Alphaproteobacteria bacterium]
MLASLRFWEVQLEQQAVLLLGPFRCPARSAGSRVWPADCERGLGRAKAMGKWALVLVSGEPEYYPKFGFVPAAPFQLDWPGYVEPERSISELHQGALAALRPPCGYGTRCIRQNKLGFIDQCVCCITTSCRAPGRFIRLVLAERGLVFLPKIEIPWERDDAFFSLNPAGDVPVLVAEDGLVVSGGTVIAEYIEETEPPAPKDLLWGEAPMRAEIRRLVHWFEFKFNREVSGPLVAQRGIKRFSGRARYHRQ